MRERTLPRPSSFPGEEVIIVHRSFSASDPADPALSFFQKTEFNSPSLGKGVQTGHIVDRCAGTWWTGVTEFKKLWRIYAMERKKQNEFTT